MVTPVNQSSSINKQGWITPETQLSQLVFPIAQKVDEASRLIPDLADLVAQYTVESDWYTSLRSIDRLPALIPPLPADILTILQSPCPPEICSKMKPEGAPYTLGEMCTLTLVPEELGTINEFESLVKSHGETSYSSDSHPLQFGYYFDRACQEYGDVPPPSTYWILHTNDVLENSVNK